MLFVYRLKRGVKDPWFSLVARYRLQSLHFYVEWPHFSLEQTMTSQDHRVFSSDSVNGPESSQLHNQHNNSWLHWIFVVRLVVLVVLVDKIIQAFVSTLFFHLDTFGLSQRLMVSLGAFDSSPLVEIGWALTLLERSHPQQRWFRLLTFNSNFFQTNSAQESLQIRTPLPLHVHIKNTRSLVPFDKQSTKEYKGNDQRMKSIMGTGHNFPCYHPKRWSNLILLTSNLTISCEQFQSSFPITDTDRLGMSLDSSSTALDSQPPLPRLGLGLGYQQSHVHSTM